MRESNESILVSSKFLLVGDPHFRVNNLNVCRDLVAFVARVVEEEKPDTVVILGDLLHDHSVVKTQAFDVACKWVHSLSLSVRVFLLVGNHDRINNQVYLTDEHPFFALSKMDNVTVVDKPFFDEKTRSVFVPYVPTGRYHEAIEPFLEKSPVCFFSHQEFYGAKFLTGISTTGDPWPESFPMNFSGHIHLPHTLQNNIVYVGSPIQHSFGEENQEKSLVVLEFPTLEWKRIPVVGVGFIHRTLDIVLGRNDVDGLQLLAQSTANSKERVRVRLYGSTMSDLREFHERHSEYLKQAESIDYLCETRIEMSQLDDYSRRTTRFVDHFLKALPDHLKSQVLEVFPVNAESTSRSHCFPLPDFDSFRVELENVGCHKKMALSFHRGITQLSAPSGSGKSTILLGVLFALCGGKVIPSGKKKSVVRLYLGDRVVIHRSKRPDILELSYDSTIFKDEEAEHMLKDWLSDDWPAISFVFQHQLCSFFSWTAEQKLSFVERCLLDGKEASDLKEIIQQKISYFSEIEKNCQQALSVLSHDEFCLMMTSAGNFDSVNKKLEELVHEESHLMNEWKNCSDYFSILEMIHNYSIQMNEASSRLLDPKQAEKLKELSRRRHMRDKLGVISTDLVSEAVESGLSELAAHWNEYEAVEKFRKQYGYIPDNAKLAELDRMMFLEDHAKAKCPECSTSILIFINWRERKVERLEKGLTVSGSVVAPLKKKTEREEAEKIIKLRSTKPRYTVSEYQKALQFKQLGEVASDFQLTLLAGHEKSQSTLDTLREQKEKLEKKLSELPIPSATLEQINERLGVVRAEIDKLRNISRLSVFRPFLNNKLEAAENRKLWLDVKKNFESARESFVNSRLDYINAELGTMLSRLFPEGMKGYFTYGRTFSLEIEWKDITFHNGKGLSGGEMERVSLAVMLAFNAAVRPAINFLLLDKSFSSLDEWNLRKCLEVLRASFSSHIVWSTHHDDCLGDEILKICS
ncbi:hypothetical protein GpartN1_g1936.t1 [Galdieria partita]|uniref:Uncharacterized protein n=1 Tax=Galdieria partita TaxID=83374 RepID=A0A9C7PTG6_9RHOD|nr:hypothetical protein GpartN1_g1936.t1 [Galdieria partita]